MATIQILAETLYQGDDYTLPVEVVDNGVAISLVGQTVGLTIKFSDDQRDDLAIFKKDIAGDSTGIVVWDVPGFNGSTYPNSIISWGTFTFPVGILFMDLKKWGADGKRSTLATGTLTVLPSTTARETPAA
jgi:hypothetical protein